MVSIDIFNLCLFMFIFYVILIIRCEILGSEFIKLSNSLPMNEENQDMVEASGKSLLAISELCKTKLQENNSFFKSLTKLESYYKKLFQQDNFFSPLYHLMNDLTNTYDPVLE